MSPAEFGALVAAAAAVIGAAMTYGGRRRVTPPRAGAGRPWDWAVDGGVVDHWKSWRVLPGGAA